MFFKIKYLHFLFIIIVLCFSQHSWSQVINYETKITIDKKGKKITQRNIIIQVNGKEDNWLSNIEIGHDPKQKLSFYYAKITDLSGNQLRKLKKKDIKTRSDLSYQAFYQDNMISEFDLYWNEYPYRIEYSYEVEESEYMVVAAWRPLLYYKIPTIKSSIEISIPQDVHVNIHQSNDLIFKESKTDGVKTYYWRSPKVQLPEYEVFSVPFSELIPFVTVVSDNFTYGVEGELVSWASLGSWFEELNKETNDLPFHETRNIKNLVRGIDNKEEIIKKIYHFLQDNTKYINIAMDVGGLKSYPASYVFQNKYGDCKALTTYMKSMLDCVGIESYYTLIQAGSNNELVNPNLPSQQFNHVILLVPIENDTIWLENTSNTTPFNYLGTFTQDRLALAVNNDESKLVRTPKLTVEDVLDQRTIEFSDDDENIWKVSSYLKLKGTSFENFRYTLNNLGESDQKKQVVSEVALKDFGLDKWEVLDFHRDSSEVILKVDGSCSDFTRKIGNWKVINPLRISIPAFEKPEERVTNIRINFPINKLDISTYRINNIVDLEVTLPKDVEISTIYGRYFALYQNSNSLIEVKEGFTLFANENISKEEYPVFYEFIDSIIRHKKKSAILIK